MGKTIRSLFNLFPGEEKRASLFLLLGFLWSLGGYGTFTLSEGMFLERVGAGALPAAYFAIAFCMCLLSGLLIYALARLPIHHILVYVIVGATLCDLSIYFLLTSTSLGDTVGFWFVFKILGWIIPIATYICFWAFIDQYFDLQDGKRLFCLFNSVLFLGDACGGGIISFGLEFLGVSGLLALFVCTMLISLPFIFLIKEKVPLIPEEHGIHTGGQKRVTNLFKSIFSSRFTIGLMIFYFVMQLLAITTEYGYMSSFERNFANASTTNELTKFLGSCAFWVSLGNMLFGFFFYSRLVKKMGINNIILIAPTFFVMVFLALFYREALPLAILAFVAREGMVYVFDDNNLVLLISGVPSKVKNQVRVTIESFFEPAGMFVAALLLLFFRNQFKWLGLGLASAALGIVFILRSDYPKAIFANLVASSLRFERRAAEWLSSFSKREKKEIELLLLSNLRKVDEPIQLLAFEYLLKMDNPRLLRRLLAEFGRFSLRGKLQAITLLSESPWAKSNVVIERLEWLKRTCPHPSLKSAIHFYFASLGLVRIKKMVDDLQSPYLGVRGAAILALKNSEDHEAQASEKLDQLLVSAEVNEICMGLQILEQEKADANIQRLLPYFQHASPLVIQAAARALTTSTQEVSSTDEYTQSIMGLLPRLQNHQVRSHLLESLGNLGDEKCVHELILISHHFRLSERKAVERVVWNIGEITIPTLVALAKDHKIHPRSRLIASKVLGKLSLSDLKTHLSPIIKNQTERAYFYFYHWQTIQAQMPEQDLSILENTLSAGFEASIDFVVQLLGIAGSIEECEVLSHSLRSSNKKIQGQAIEMLEKTCNPKLFGLLSPLINPRYPEEKIRDYLRGGRIPLNFTQLLEELSHSPTPAEQIIALTLKARLGTPGWKESLKRKIDQDQTAIKHFAHELLQT